MSPHSSPACPRPGHDQESSRPRCGPPHTSNTPAENDIPRCPQGVRRSTAAYPAQHGDLACRRVAVSACLAESHERHNENTFAATWVRYQRCCLRCSASASQTLAGRAGSDQLGQIEPCVDPAFFVPGDAGTWTAGAVSSKMLLASSARRHTAGHTATARPSREHNRSLATFFLIWFASAEPPTDLGFDSLALASEERPGWRKQAAVIASGAPRL